MATHSVFSLSDMLLSLLCDEAVEALEGFRQDSMLARHVDAEETFAGGAVVGAGIEVDFGFADEALLQLLDVDAEVLA